MTRRALAGVPLLLSLAGCGGEPAPPPSADPPDPAYLAEIESYRAEREGRLRQPDSWLSLAGLYWLREGASSFGSDPRSDLVFPEGKAPASLGTLHRQGRSVRLEAAPGAEITGAGEPVTDLVLASDAAGEPTVLEHGSLSFYVIERGERVGVRLKDSERDLLRSFAGMDYYDVDPSWRLEARFEAYPEPRTIEVPNVLGDVSEQPGYGSVVFTVAGREHRLEPLGEPDGELFLIFGDETNGHGTYGGGRFLYAGPPDASGRLLVDFNKAYNPPCVFSPYATCPLPPPANRLALRVEAGEKTFGEGH